MATIPWRRRWQPPPVLSAGKAHGPTSLAGCSPHGRRVRQTEQLNNNKKNCSRTRLDIPTTPPLLVCITKPPTSTPTGIYLLASQEALCPFRPLRTEVHLSGGTPDIRLISKWAGQRAPPGLSAEHITHQAALSCSFFTKL